MADPTFPWEMFLQAQMAKTQNQQKMMELLGQGLAGLGQGVGQGLQKRGQMRAQTQLGQALNPTPGQSGPPTAAGVGPSDVNWGNVTSLMGRAGYDPTSLISQMAKGKMGGQGGEMRNVWRKPETNEVTDVQPADPTGWVKYPVKSGQALQIVTNAPHQKAAEEARTTWAQAWKDRIKFNQIDILAKSVTLTNNQRNVLQQNNMRANRAIQIANQATTWQEFSAMVTDAGAVMQGGVPHIDQLHNMAYPSWKQDLARIQTYLTSTPTANVPQEFKDRIIGMMQGIQEVDNRYLDQHSKFMEKMLLPTIEGGQGLKTPIEDITKTITERIPYTGGGLKLGAIKKGHRYKGGEPSDQNSWEPIK